jgi:hypothetical protein
MSVLLGMQVARYSEDINGFFLDSGLNKDLTYTIYAFLDVAIAIFIISICRFTDKKYWLIPIVFFFSILTHFTYVTLIIFYSSSEIFPIGEYLYIMIALNLFVIVLIGLFSDGFTNGVQYVADTVARCHGSIFHKLSSTNKKAI